MNKKTIGIAIVIIVIIGGISFLGGRNSDVVETETPEVAELSKTGIMIDFNQVVVIQGHRFLKTDIEIEAGITVIWRNRDNLVGLPYNKHTVTSGIVDKTGVEGVKGVVANSGSGRSDGMYQSGLGLNDIFDYTFTEPGVYAFYIAEHPSVSGEGRIVVRERTESISGETIVIESKSFSFSPDTLRANAGRVVGLNIITTGEHTFTIDELGVDVPLPHGETTRVEFTPEQTGTFQFYCKIPGHKEAGQVGTIVVE